MTVDQQTTDTPRFKDRSTGLAIYGYGQIVMGVLSALMIPLMLLSLTVSPATGEASNLRMMIPTAGIYTMLAVGLIGLGVGSIRARRWARALTLVLAWMWLAMGVMSFVMMLVWMPNMSDLIAQQEQPPPQAMIFAYVVMMGTMGCMYLVLPVTFIAFYQRADVKATCELKDPHVRWTDHCPLPVLALSLMLGFAAASMIFSGGYGFVMPFFGILLKGVPAALASLSVTVLFAYLAWATYKLKMSAWWTTLGAYVVFGVSAVVTFSRISLMDLYREMNIPVAQLEIIEKSGMVKNFPWMMGVGFAVVVAYMLYVRRYFVAGSTSEF